MSKTLKTSIQNKIDAETNWESSTFKSLTGEMYIYRANTNNQVSHKNICGIKFGDGVNSVPDLPFAAFDSTQPTLKTLAVPTQKGVVKYNTASQSPEWNNYNVAKMDIGGTTSATNPGTYSATFKPKSGYCWEDGSTTVKTVQWTLSKGDSRIWFVDANNNEISLSNVTFDIGATSQSYDFEYTGSTSFKCSVLDTSIVSASITGFGLTLQPGSSNGTTTVELYSDETDYYYGSPILLIEVTNNSVSKSLELYTWQEISDIAKSGNAPSIFKVGDTKSVYINKWESLEHSHTFCAAGDYYVYIIGFNHMPEDNPNTIDFQLYKPTSYASEPPAMLYVDPMNYTSWQDDHSLFCMYTGEETYEIEVGTSIDTKSRMVGSWEKIYDECLKPDTGWSLYDMLPAELTDVMIKMYPVCNIYSESGDVQANVGVGCYLTFPSATEVAHYVHGGITPMYEYYEKGNTAIKKKQNGSAHGYWTRDTQWYLADYFDEDFNVVATETWCSPISIDDSGKSHSTSATDAYYHHNGIAPIFRVGQ